MEEKDKDILLKKIEALGEDINEMENIDIEHNFKLTQKKIKNIEKVFFMNKITQYAAILALPLLISSLILFYMLFNKPEQKVEYAQVTSSTGTIIRYELPDKSVVWLNSGSKLTYPTVFSKESRDVKLNGEAYFEVSANKQHPFYVHTSSGMKVFVYGTKFNISAYDDEKDIETVLESGKVNIVTPDNKMVVLKPGEEMIFNKESNNLNKSEVDVYEKVAWKDGKMIFRNATLDVILKRLARHFNVDIQINNRYGKEYKYRATFRNESLQQILDYLAKSAALKWRIEEAKQNDDGTLTKRKITVDLY